MPTFMPFNTSYRMKRILYLILILAAATACREVFEAPPQALLKATLLNSANSESVKPVVTVFGIGLDSLFYKEESLSELILPLSPNDTTRFVISFDSTIDTVTFVHETTMKYASMESGFYYEYKLRNIGFTINKIDSILITDSLVTKTWHENIKLYIHP